MKRNLAYITGIGACIPQNHDCEALKKSLISGASPIRTHDLDSAVISAAGFTQEEIFSLCELMDPADLRYAEYTIAFLYKALKEALGKANLDVSSVDPKRVALLYGTCQAGLVRVEHVAKEVLAGNTSTLHPEDFPGTLFSYITKHVTEKLGVSGQVLTFSSACAASNNALGHAADLIRHDQVDIVIVATLDVLAKSTNAGFYALQALIGERCAPFSTPTGLNLGEGAGVFILENDTRLGSQFLKNHWVVAGYGLSGDAYHITAPAVDGNGAIRCMNTAMKDARIESSEVDYIKAHGTGTPANDSAESKAFYDIFGGDIPVSSLKGFLGHTLGASGALDIICFLLLNEEGYLPPNYNFKEKREYCSNLNFVPDSLVSHKAQTIIANSFAFGGNNSSCILTRSPQVHHRLAQEDWELMPVYLNDVGIVHSLGDTNEAVFSALIQGSESPAYDDEHQAVVSLIPEVKLPGEMKSFRRSPKKTQLMIKSLEEIIQRSPHLLKNDKTGIIGGNVLLSSGVVEKYMSSVFAQEATMASAMYFPMTTLNTTSGVASIAYPIIGYNTTLVGSISAFSYGYELVRSDRQNNILVAAADDLSPMIVSLFKKSRLQSPRRTRLFPTVQMNLAEKASSLVISNIKTAESVKVLNHKSLPLRDQCYEDLINGILSEAGLKAKDLDFVVSTGGGQDVLARQEDAALDRHFADHPVVTSITGALGYGLSSSVLCSHWFAFNCFQSGKVPLLAGLPKRPYIQTSAKNLQAGSIGLVINSDITGLCSALLLQK